MSLGRLKADIFLLLNTYTHTIFGCAPVSVFGSGAGGASRISCTKEYLDRAFAIMQYINDVDKLREVFQIIQNEISLMDKGKPLKGNGSISKYFVGDRVNSPRMVPLAKQIPRGTSRFRRDSEYRRILERIKLLT